MSSVSWGMHPSWEFEQQPVPETWAGGSRSFLAQVHPLDCHPAPLHSGKSNGYPRPVVRVGLPACRNLRLQLFEIRTCGGWSWSTTFLSLHLGRIAQDCQQRSRHHFFTVYFGPLPQAMTQDPQVNILLLFCERRPVRRPESRETLLLIEYYPVWAELCWAGGQEGHGKLCKHLSSHCALPR